MTNPLIAIWGAGFVGATCYQAFSKVSGWDVIVWDKFPDKCKLKQEMPDANFDAYNAKVAYSADLHFICVPTPMNKETGQCFTGIVEEVAKKIANHNKHGADIVIKSTVPPGTTKRLNDKYGRVFFNPEFLTEADAYEDFVSLPYQIVGNPGRSRSTLLATLYQNAAKQGVIEGGKMMLDTDSTVAEMVKLTRNCYLATRLSFFNEIKQLCDKLEVNYDDMRALAGMDERIGTHYNRVSDDNPGWGLSCLPKDLNDLMFVAKDLGVDPKVMKAVWEKNLEVRKHRDWEEMEKAVKNG
jgi:UDPglucose 6-dehydrogenase